MYIGYSPIHGHRNPRRRGEHYSRISARPRVLILRTRVDLHHAERPMRRASGCWYVQVPEVGAQYLERRIAQHNNPIPNSRYGQTCGHVRSKEVQNRYFGLLCRLFRTNQKLFRKTSQNTLPNAYGGRGACDRAGSFKGERGRRYEADCHRISSYSNPNLARGSGSRIRRSKENPQ